MRLRVNNIMPSCAGLNPKYWSKFLVWKEIRMDSKIRKHLDNLRSEERELQNQAFFYILEATEKPVDWAYEVWDELVAGLRHKDNHVRAISAQVLCSLAKSDPENRM